MAKDLNKVQVTGRLGADPEMRYTAQGSAVTNFNVASNRSWRDREGTQHDDTEWFRIVAWDKLGEICNQYLTKGSKVYIEGRLQTRKWTDQNGQDRYTTEVVAQDMIILSSRNERGDADGQYDGPDVEFEPAPAPTQAPARREAPVAANGGGRAPAAAPAARPSRGPARNAPQPVEDDDIPF